jgi:hypothetical protein
MFGATSISSLNRGAVNVAAVIAVTWMILFWTLGAVAQETRSRARYVPNDIAKDIPGDVKDLIKNAQKKTVFEVVGSTPFAERVLKTDKLIFQPGSTLVLTGLRTGESLVVIAGEVVLQDANLANRIIRDPAFVATPGSSGPPGATGQPDYQGPRVTRRSANGGPGGTGFNGTPAETFKPPIVYWLVGKMTHPVIPSRFVVDFTGIQGGAGGAGGAGGTGGHGDIGWTAQCNWLTQCLSGPGRGGDGGPGGLGGRGCDAVAGGPGFDLIIGGSDDFLGIAEQFTILNKGGDPGLPGGAGPAGGGGQRGQGGQTCGMCNSRGDGVDGRPGGSQGPGTPSNVTGDAGHITFAYGVDVPALLRM